MPRNTLLRRLVASTTVALVSLAGLSVTASSASASSADPGTVTAWGYNGAGQTNVPADLQGKDVTAVSAGFDHSLALTSDGAVTAWGNRGNDVPDSLAGKVVTTIAAGWYADAALTSDGKVTVWGDNGNGELNVPASLDSKTVTAISMSQFGGMALTSDGTITVWGDNVYGQQDIPPSLEDKTVTAIDVGPFASMALTSDGKVTVWGLLADGQQNVPASLDDKSVIAIDTGDSVSMALTSDGKVFSWGDNYAGQNDIPASLDDQIVTAISAGNSHELALTSDGTVVAWGSPGAGATTVPADLANVTQISGGYFHNLVLAGAGSSDFGTGVTATVTGTPKVGSTLTADAGDVVPAADSLTYRWFADDVVIPGATESTFTSTSAQKGAEITVEVTAVKADYNDSIDLSDPTAAVAAGSFAATGSATITGTLRVGETLTADAGVVAPTPDSLEYQWYADDAVIDGADSSTFMLTAAQKDSAISVKVTAVRAGYTSSSSTSAKTAGVASNLAPTLDLGAATSRLRLGQSTGLTWTSDDADSVTSSGGWTGARDDTGTVTVRPRSLGGTTYVLSATNDNGTTTAMVTVQVRRPAKTLRVGASNGRRLGVRRVVVTTVGLDAREPYVLRIAGVKVATGKATMFGRVNRTITLPTGTRAGNATVTVTGSESDRIGRDSFRVAKRALRAR